MSFKEKQYFSISDSPQQLELLLGFLKEKISLDVYSGDLFVDCLNLLGLDCWELIAMDSSNRDLFRKIVLTRENMEGRADIFFPLSRYTEFLSEMNSKIKEKQTAFYKHKKDNEQD
jgi:hypothetical protein